MSEVITLLLGIGLGVVLATLIHLILWAFSIILLDHPDLQLLVGLGCGVVGYLIAALLRSE